MHSFLANAANTDDVIRWDALQERIEKAPPGLSDQERCELLIAAANGHGLSREQWNQLVGLVVVSGGPPLIHLPEPTRQGVLGVLAEIEKGRNLVELRRLAAESASRSVVLVPSWHQGTRRDRIVATGMPGALAFTLWLLLDPQRPFGSDLCRCQYSACRQFFFRRPAKGGIGAPRRRYCSDGHAKAADTEQAAERMRRTRR
jgi:hypothetical protein